MSLLSVSGPDPRPSYRVAVFGLAQKLQRVLEIVLRHARHNPYRFELATAHGPGEYDIAMVDMTARGSRDVARTLMRLPRHRPVVRVGRRTDARRGQDDLLLGSFTVDVLKALNRVIDPRQAAAALAVAPRVPIDIGVSGALRASHPEGGLHAAAAGPRPAGMMAMPAYVAARQASRDRASAGPDGTVRAATTHSPMPFASTTTAASVSADAMSGMPMSAPERASPAPSWPAAGQVDPSVPPPSARLAAAAAQAAAPMQAIDRQIVERQAVQAQAARLQAAQAQAAQRQPAGRLATDRLGADRLAAERRGTERLSAERLSAERSAAAAAAAAAATVAARAQVQAREQAFRAPAEAEAPAAPARPRALVVDDSPTVRRQLALALSQLGIDCEAVATAEEALDMLSMRRFDLMFVDVVLPLMDGYRLTREIRRDRALRAMPVTILTTRSSPFDLARGALAGCTSYLVKPVSLRTLHETVQRQLSRAGRMEWLPAALRAA